MKRVLTTLLKSVCIIALVLCGMDAQAQGNLVTGAVRDAKGEPVIGATVIVKGTATGATSGADGRYSIQAGPDATSYTVAYWKGSASAPESEYAYKTGIASTATSQELTNLESNTSYWAKVKAVGSLDSDWSETANATTMDSGGEPLLPTADLLDVVFRNDGSAMDNSSSATPVRRMPSSRP